MNRTNRLPILFLVILSAGLWAESKSTTGFDFLRTDMGARPASMGGAFAAVTGDLHALLYNPAGLADLTEFEGTFTYLNHLLDIQSGFAAVNKPIPGAGNAVLGVSYTHYGDFERTDILGDVSGTFVPADVVLSAGYADTLSMGLRYGAAVKYVYSVIDGYSAGAVALDAGVIYPIPAQQLYFGASVLNVGSAVKSFLDTKEVLPTSLRLGVGKRLAHLPLFLNFNLIRYFHTESDIAGGLYWTLGGEFTLTSRLLFRWGYHSRGSEGKMDVQGERLSGVNLGVGLLLGAYHLDFGMSSLGALGSLNYLTLSMPF